MRSIDNKNNEIEPLTKAYFSLKAKIDELKVAKNEAAESEDFESLALFNKAFQAELDSFRAISEAYELRFENGTILRGADALAIRQLAKDNDLEIEELCNACELSDGRLVGISLVLFNIESIEALRHCKHIKSFEYAGNIGCVLDLSPLASCTMLEEFLCQGALTSLETLSELSELRTVSLINSEISDIGFLGSLKKLENLDLSENPISDIRALAGLISLRHLFINSTKVTSLNAISGCMKLKALHCNDTDISILDALTDKIELEHLGLSNTKVSVLNALAGCSGLRSLSLTGCNGVSDISALAKLSCLKELFIGATLVDNIKALSDMDHLTVLDASGLKWLNNISPIAGCKELTYLKILGCNVSDIDVLRACKKLKELDLSYNPVEDITFLEGLPELTGVSFDGCKDIESFAPLLKLDDLVYVKAMTIAEQKEPEIFQQLRAKGVNVRTLTPVFDTGF